MAHELVFNVTADGIALEVNGVTGKECAKITELIEKELGSVAQRTLKPEYTRRAQEQVRSGQRAKQ
jgi:hypothetical protein